MILQPTFEHCHYHKVTNIPELKKKFLDLTQRERFSYLWKSRKKIFSLFISIVRLVQLRI